MYLVQAFLEGYIRYRFAVYPDFFHKKVKILY